MFKWWHKRNQSIENVELEATVTKATSKTELPKSTGLTMSSDEKQIVTLISTAIAAEDRPDSTFKVTRINKLKERIGLPMSFEEKNRVILITSAIAASDRPESNFHVTSVIKLK